MTKVDWDGLKDAFSSSVEGAEWYLGLVTGETIFIGALDPYAGEVTPDDIEDDPDRYAYIEPPSSSEAYEWMEEFTENVEDGQLKEKLWITLDGRGAFRRFRNVLTDYPEQKEACRKFEDVKINNAIEEWIQNSDIEPENSPSGKHKTEK